MGEQLEFADTQMAAIHLIDEITGHDQQGLAALDLAGLRAQVDARQTLYDYVDALWENAKAAGLNPAVRPEYSGLAGLRDLTEALVTYSDEALSERDE